MQSRLFDKIKEEQLENENLLETFNRMAEKERLPKIPVGLVYSSERYILSTQRFIAVLSTKFPKINDLFRHIVIAQVREPLENEPLIFTSRTNLKTFLQCLEHKVVAGSLKNSS